ncbi:S-adenosyl-L-methionine-dependent methyltransferase [Hypoxylon trugodes]|uniref:S-adenosyl-L-methionine-dependent methyltransferase n=1 Tax=Hypoxylon trugodes TaxID=326681 RepID=UPI00219ADD76|nr:S-adenosyl-L-methionine-dependent methyltransferase [Hypoxylon trugodes]KAI1387804.1 S-adenosyl-L-methionine-dependent methyltransferase [Hypoxylon trugodes]
MDAILEQLRALALQADDAGRHKVLDFMRDLRLQLETPHDTLSRFSGMHLEITVARMGEDLDIFKHLAESEQPLNIEALATKTGAAHSLLGHILRYLASVGMIHETGPGTFTANGVTRTLAQPGYRGGIYHFFDNIGPIFQAFPAFLAETKYQDINDPTKTPFQKAFATDRPAFQWLPSQPERFAHIQQVMTVQGAHGAPWFSIFPFEKEIDSFSGSPVLVDVGGGFGHQCTALLTALPQLRDKLILQDLPQTLELLQSHPDGIEVTPHNFFEPQPVKDARFYYLRTVLHDYPDDKCIAILKHLVDAFGPDSHILIDEMVLPTAGVPWEATTIDLTMMACLGARERTVAEWHTLLDAAGLRVERIDTYSPRRRDSIIQAVPK